MTAIEVTSAIVVLQDATATYEAALWKEPLEDLGDAPRDEQLTRLANKTALVQLVARMTVATNKVKEFQQF